VPRTQRVNEVLRQVLAEQLPRIADLDPTVGLLTVTGVTVEPDLRHATVWLDSLPEPAKASLATHRAELQSAIATQMHMKRTPLLAFAVDPAVTTGGRIEQILRQLGPTDGSEAAGAGEEHDE
jgi:ribosome-binding factor A